MVIKIGSLQNGTAVYLKQYDSFPNYTIVRSDY